MRQRSPRPSSTSPTERRLGASMRLHTLAARDVVALMGREDARAVRAVARARPALARASEAVARALSSGGRLCYAGAGTSGRIAALDATELVPTFGIPPSRVKVLLAGGRRALARAVEGAEDDAPAGARLAKTLGPSDVLIAVAASGRTPFTLACLREARKRGAATIAVTVDPASPLAREAAIAVVTPVGPEVVTGSTRLKAGTAAKLALNAISTAAMVCLGRVHENLMIDMPATNEKLRQRARRIVQAAAGVGPQTARRALDRRGSIRAAVDALRPGLLDARGRR